MNEGIEKKADNLNLEVKQKISKIDNEIDIASTSLKKLDDMKESLVNINKSLDKCFSLLRESVKSKSMAAEFDDLSNKNLKSLNKLTDNIEDDKKNIRNNLMDEKEKIQKKSYDKK